MDIDGKREHWRGLLAEQEQSGQSVREWCAANGLKEWQYYAWKTRLKPKPPARADSGGAFLPVDLPLGGALSIRFGQDIHVEISAGCDAQLVRVALEALRRRGRCWR